MITYLRKSEIHKGIPICPRVSAKLDSRGDLPTGSPAPRPSGKWKSSKEPGKRVDLGSSCFVSIRIDREIESISTEYRLTEFRGPSIISHDRLNAAVGRHRDE
jgi:hypothetical protein